jgi:hypothetical protein
MFLFAKESGVKKRLHTVQFYFACYWMADNQFNRVEPSLQAVRGNAIIAGIMLSYQVWPIRKLRY